jgi:transposase
MRPALKWVSVGFNERNGMSHWAATPLDRMQVTLFAPTLDDSLVADHPARLFDEMLRALDFSQWENRYVRVVGQPPIHPRVMAAGILYGLSLGMRSSRKLEDACYNRLDFIWLMEGRKPDHATFCNFRTEFGCQLKDLFRQVGRLGIEMGLATLNQVTLDGTSIQANSSRHRTGRSQQSLVRKLAVLDEQIERAMEQFQQRDQIENELYGESSPARLPRSLKDLQRRQATLKRAMDKLAALEAQRVKRTRDPSRKGPQVPLADPDSRVLPNKNGGHAPNYTAVLAVDCDSGLLLDTQVRNDGDETAAVMPAMERIEENFQNKPDQLAADSGFNTGSNLAALERAGIEPLMPDKQAVEQEVAARPDPACPVDADKRAALPINPQNKKLDKAAFIYDSGRDVYFCPMGRTLDYVEDKKYSRSGSRGTYRVYECALCAGCPLAGRCLAKKASVRRVCRDEHESIRERMRRRLKSESGKEQYKHRSHVAETPFAFLKSAMGLRQFLHRGMEKVDNELRWAATAYNLKRLIRLIAPARQA